MTWALMTLVCTTRVVQMASSQQEHRHPTWTSWCDAAAAAALVVVLLLLLLTLAVLVE
jgi:hypothetical protein